jgi:hypothetical protein
MTRPTQGTGGPAMRPLCYNREPMRMYAANTQVRVIVAGDKRLELHAIQIAENIPWAFTQKCMSWASDPSTDPVPMAENWRCAGCRHFPADLVELAEKRRQERLTRSSERGSSAR